MKTLLLLCFLFPAVQMADGSLADITRALGGGDTASLGAYMDASIELAFDGEEATLPKAEATARLAKFFATHKPKGFSEVHQGSSKGKDSRYCIGDLMTSTKTFRVYIYMKVSGADYVIQELRID